MYGVAHIADYGPSFSGHTFKVDDGIVCVIPDRPERQRAVAASMRQLVRAVGGDCGECRRCPIAALS
jgi:hypothetical protein